MAKHKQTNQRREEEAKFLEKYLCERTINKFYLQNGSGWVWRFTAQKWAGFPNPSHLWAVRVRAQDEEQVPWETGSSFANSFHGPNDRDLSHLSPLQLPLVWLRLHRQRQAVTDAALHQVSIFGRCDQIETNWYIGPNPEDRINPKPKDRKKWPKDRMNSKTGRPKVLFST